MSDPIQKSTKKANKLEEFFSGWSRTAQAVIGLSTAVGTILISVFTFAEKHADRLMERAVNDVSEKIEQRISVTSGRDSLMYERAEMLAFKVIVRLDSLTHVSNRLDNEIKAVKSEQRETDVRFDMIWRKLNELPEPSREQMEMDSIRAELTRRDKRDAENRRIDSLHRESVKKAIEQLNEIKSGDRNL